MVYVTKDGTICESVPFGLEKILRAIYALIGFIVYFFKSLVGMDVSSDSKSRSNHSFRGSGGSGGGSGGPGGPGGPRGGPDGRSKRIFTMRDINPPTIGGCPGGSCPR